MPCQQSVNNFHDAGSKNTNIYRIKSKKEGHLQRERKLFTSSDKIE
jgi:hypothetical protein